MQNMLAQDKNLFLLEIGYISGFLIGTVIFTDCFLVFLSLDGYFCPAYRHNRVSFYSLSIPISMCYGDLKMVITITRQ
jgi:hypothetical protein